jgi:MoaA/NifB/PqqE/SkfB family radical SAM enzyme
MNSITYLTGRARTVFNIRLKTAVFLHFGLEVLRGRFSLLAFPGFLRRLLYFLSNMKENKYVTSNGRTKVNLYVPAFPSEAFYKACRKVATVGIKQPCITVLLSITSACRFCCAHCYQKLDRGKDVPIEQLVEVLGKLDDMGVAFFNIEGGDPFLVYDRLTAVCKAVRVGEIWINSTGDGVTRERLDELKSMGVKGVIFSLHAPNDVDVNRFMGRDDAWSMLHQGIACCHAAGLDVAVNTCLLRGAFRDGSFEQLMEVTRSLGVSIIQLIKPKPSGGWLGADLELFTESDLASLAALVHRYNNAPEFRDYPFIAAQILDEDSTRFGCTAGGTDRFYINAKGDVQPCEFLNISFGNIMQEPFEDIYARMRAAFDIPGDRWLCEVCAGHIHALRVEHDVRTLPLDEELSACVMQGLDRGRCPDFYQFVETRYRKTGKVKR